MDTDRPPPPSRRDHRSPAASERCDCGGCREAAAIYAEPRREYPAELLQVDRAIATERARHQPPRTAA